LLKKTKLIISAITTITVFTLSVALHTNTIIHQQEAFAQTNNNTFKRYENPTYGINIQYPSDWRADGGDIYADDYVTDIVSFIAPIRSNTNPYAPSLSISIDNLLPNLNEYLTRITTDYSDTYEDFNVIDSDTDSILSGKPAYKIVFTDEEDGIDYKNMEVGTIIEDKVYFVTHYAEEEQYLDYLPTIQKMISSVKMTKSSGGLETDSSTTRKGSYEINLPRNQLTGRYYEGLDWREICNNPLASNYISQPCDSLVTSDGNALTPNGKQVMEDFLCPRGRGVISTIELLAGPIPDRLESELATACGW
jgi:hypothetical protein